MYDRNWIIKNSVETLTKYDNKITLRQLYYRLVAVGMVNDVKHYKKVIGAMTKARWEGVVDFDAFIDRERDMCGVTDAEPIILSDQIEKGQDQIRAWMEAYHLNRWENQPRYVEVWIEKKALQGVFERPCLKFNVGLAPCKGYPSLTFLNDARDRFEDAQDRGQSTIILYFGDYDPSGEDIPRSIQENLSKMGVDVNVERIALNQRQITDMSLPSVPAKVTDSRSRTWKGDGVVELDAIDPKVLTQLVTDAIHQRFNDELYKKLMKREQTEREQYQKVLKSFVETL